ncbi:DUF4350 domain-containing protein [Phormidium pseudopriestleyi FRX01]|uniref:DUF4350 domain-containing protein n=1 Tax=Phormidium pseudopriestleyi FRX01 TaxID=1759528 RepID=A0ABS3FTH5_9CYAN|nr:DUF4350 domain-containing protein [Phormidium pseudopriestleyi]MBO0350415.1 DUF4350 domain-containing protein [Phormidium pseudopriestleyi FRX01]
MNLSNRKLGVFAVLAIGAIILLTFVMAPANSGRINNGSTYRLNPDGYGAWYAYMEAREVPIQRWKKPGYELIESEAIDPSVTLIHVDSRFTRERRGESDSNLLSELEQNWVKQGNIIVILGITTPVTEAPFSTLQESDFGEIKIDTMRRNRNASQVLLGDEFGAMVWQENIGQGKVIYANTPYLAANAYQDMPGNYEFLANLVSEGDRPIFIDEYSHGYKDTEVIEREQRQTLVNYFLQTPVFPALVQGILLIIVLIWANNRRLGQLNRLSTPGLENSKAYIQALAGVLQKAGRRDFIVEVVGKEEQLQLQKALGLASVPLDYETLAQAWAEKTGRPATELMQQLQVISQPRRLRKFNLLGWVKKWAAIRRAISL